MRKKLFTIFTLIVLAITALPINSYADTFYGKCSDLIDNATFKSYITEKYGITSHTDYVCSNSGKEDEYPYKIDVAYPIERTCYSGEARSGLSVKDVTCCEAFAGANTVATGEIGDYSETEVSGDDLDATGMGCPANTTLTSKVSGNIAAYTTIYTKNQLAMDSVDINIINGSVKISGLLDDDEAGWNMIYKKYKGVIVGVSGFCALTCVLVFIISAIKLGGTAGNPLARKKTMAGMLVSGAGTLVLGAVCLFFSIFYNLI